MNLNIMLVDDQPPRAAMLARALTDQGHCVLCKLTSAAGLRERVLANNPDVVLVDMDAPDRDALESMALMQQETPRPMAMFHDQDAEALLIAALRAGVSTYVAGNTDVLRVREVMKVATARYREYHALCEELETTGDDPAAAAVIGRAKALLMQRRRITERDAYRALRRQAMSSGEPLLRVARHVLDYAALLKSL